MSKKISKIINEWVPEKSKVIDFVQLKWRMTTKATIAVVGLCLFIYVVFFWIDTVQEIRFEIIYF
jgi:hypothetical protein